MFKPAAVLVCSSLAAKLVLAASFATADDSREAFDFFERQVRPILVESCQSCHSAKKQESDLRLDSREAALRGGVSGAAIVPGEPDNSLLVSAIRYDGDVQMPPKGKLTDAQIAALTRWVELGAPWPNEPSTTAPAGDAARTHWAFQPVRDPAPPALEGEAPQNSIDAFVRARLAQENLPFSPPADRRTLLRRATFDLTGLPPSPEEVEAFQRDDDPKAYEKLIERLLATPHYGEHWGRHWLDVARYSDTKGYVYGREQRIWPHAWVYRDWVVKALNDDLPYDRFLLLQIAADQAAPDDRSSLAAMGFLTLGRRFLGVQRDIIDDRIDVVTRGAMGLTVACARCHDHKYDPIPTRDYYSLYGVFQSCVERLTPVSEPISPNDGYEKFAAELAKREQALAQTMAERRKQTADRNRTRVGDYLAAQMELNKYPEEGFDQILATTDLLPTFVRRWQDYLASAKKRNDPVFVPWHAYAETPAADFSSHAVEITKQLAARPAGEVAPLVAARFIEPPASMGDVAKRYGELFAEIDRQWQTMVKNADEQQQPAPAALPDPAAEALRQILYGRTGPCEVPDEPIVNIEYFFDSDSCNVLWKLQNDVENWILQAPPEVRHAIVLNDRDPPTTPRVFKRGNPANKGDETPRQFVEVLAGPERQPFASGSGRLELAQAMVDPKNPLTARVMVNRVWMHHFGSGLVRTPSDFGVRADPPSHPELLDWLTSRFIEDGWSLKQLHRRIMLSETYRQSALGPADAGLRAKAAQADPENRLLWRMNAHRLSFEEMRDALLAAAGRLDRTVGGRSGDLFSPTFMRRSLYGTIDRQFLPGTLRMFDFANPDLHIPQRSETTVPQQALFFLNDPLLVSYARLLAERTATAESPATRIEHMHRIAYQRSATAEQLQSALEFIELAGEGEPSDVSSTAAAWQYGLGSYDESSQRVVGFEKLPHFTGSAWQGGPNYPDAKLGWVQLTATGGHPGNDLAHAAVRRWTAPRDMRIRIDSTLIHEPTEGQGVRGFVVSSRGGLLQHAAVHHGQAALNVESLDVVTGETIDFVADIGQQLSYNQYLWKAIITPESEPNAPFDSEKDFQQQSVEHLSAWEQLAQVILSSNEFLFVD
jgi:hypothetical protein